VLDKVTERLTTNHWTKDTESNVLFTGLAKKARNAFTKKIGIPVAVVFTKLDAFYPTLPPGNRLMARPAETPAYDEADGANVHEEMLALMKEWDATGIESTMRQNFSTYRYFGVSALGAEPDYATSRAAAGGVQPHRIEDPVLWLLAKLGRVPTS
jgi:predicted membrane-bound mannosyltransferase